MFHCITAVLAARDAGLLSGYDRIPKPVRCLIEFLFFHRAFLCCPHKLGQFTTWMDVSFTGSIFPIANSNHKRLFRIESLNKSFELLLLLTIMDLETILHV